MDMSRNRTNKVSVISASYSRCCALSTFAGPRSAIDDELPRRLRSGTSHLRAHGRNSAASEAASRRAFRVIVRCPSRSACRRVGASPRRCEAIGADRLLWARSANGKPPNAAPPSCLASLGCADRHHGMPRPSPAPPTSRSLRP